MTVRDPLDRLGQSVAEALPDFTEEERLRQRARIVDGPVDAPRPPSTMPVWGWGLAAATVAAVLVVSMFVVPGQDGSSVAVMLPPLQQVESKIDEEPVVVASAETKDPDQPTDAMVLESGRLKIDAGTKRKIVAGPCVVTSDEDARFELGWDADAQTMTLEVEEGEVAVARAGSHHVVVAGDVVRSTQTEFVVTHLSKAQRAETIDPRPVTPWVRAAKRGEYRRALELAKGVRATASLRTLGKDELKLLADAMRLGGAPQEAEAVLLELRRRFPRSAEARRAAFYLGRASETALQHEDAIRWYRSYLTAAPKGSLAAQTRGRLLRVLSQHGTEAEAAAAARDYLEHHPQGAYAALASRLSTR